MFLLPNLIIPGAPKSATTSLCEYFKSHADIFVPRVKEPRFFIAPIIQNLPEADSFRDYLVDSSILTLDGYENLYKDSGGAKYRCDASVHYLYYHNLVIPEIKKYIEEPTIIIILRNPVDRAFSNYTYLKRDSQNSFEQAIGLEKQRKEEGWNSFWFYIDQGFYYDQVKHYLDAFAKVKVVLMEDINRNVNSTLNDIFDFLEIPHISIDTKAVHNKTGVPKNRFVDWLIFKDNFLKKGTRYLVNKKYNKIEREGLRRRIKDRFLKKSDVKLSPETYNKLVDLYSEDILKLQGIIKRDLTAWLTKK